MELTKAEKAWVNKVNKLLKECPSKRIGFYTIGDPTVSLFNVEKFDEIHDYMMNHRSADFGPAADAVGADFGEDLIFPNAVESTSG